MLGMPDGVDFEDGLAVRMLTPPKVEAVLGCDGDMFWMCFPDEQVREADGSLDVHGTHAKRLAQLQAQVASSPILAPDKLAALVARSANRVVTRPDPQLGPEPTKVASVPSDACEVSMEDCGEARRLVGTTMTDGKQVAKVGSGVIAKDLDSFCGFWGGWEIEIRE